VRADLEVAVTSAAGAAAAAAGGADRVELCSALELGGVTPSTALVEACAGGPLPVHVLVRCRPGSFVYDDTELALMERDVRLAVRAGAAGVVVGALTAAGGLDVDSVRRLVSAARDERADVQVTVHRAIDHCADVVAGAALLPSAGVDRVLTSGGAPAAAGALAVLVRMAAVLGPVQLMAGGGVSPAAVPALVGAGVDAVHLSAKRRVRGTGGHVALGAAGGTEHFVTDPVIVAAARAALDAAARTASHGLQP